MLRVFFVLCTPGNNEPMLSATMASVPRQGDIVEVDGIPRPVREVQWIVANGDITARVLLQWVGR